MFKRNVAVDIVTAALRELMEQSGVEGTDALTEDTVIVGANAVLDSVAVVSLIVDVEQRLESEHSVSVTLASDKAMSQRSSPFRTIGVLADHVCAVIEEEAAA